MKLTLQTNNNWDRHFYLAKWIDEARWKYAASMPKFPHEYTLRKWNSDAEFDDAVMFIREFGYAQKFYKSTYMYFDFNGWHHWSMGAPVKDTILINRGIKKYNTVYDEIAASYDGLFADPESNKETNEVLEMVGAVDGRVLDVGCGTGLLLDGCKVGDYTGIDISTGMLDVLRKKHPDSSGKIMCSSFEDCYMTGFDKIVALFGVANYIPEKHLQRIPMMLNPGGSAFLMFYGPDYSPVTYSKTGTVVPSNSAYEPKDGDIPYNNYFIRKITAQ